jgi:hypothetical protein
MPMIEKADFSKVGFFITIALSATQSKRRPEYDQ